MSARKITANVIVKTDYAFFAAATNQFNTVLKSRFSCRDTDNIYHTDVSPREDCGGTPPIRESIKIFLFSAFGIMKLLRE